MPDNDSRKSRRSGYPGPGYGGAGGYGYGYGAGGYGYGGGYGGGYGESPSRSFRDYLLIVRERIWYILVVFLIVFAATTVYTLSRTKLYEASASIRLLRDRPSLIPGVRDPVDESIRQGEDLNTQVQLLGSGILVQRVAERLRDEDLRRFMAPFEGGPSVVSHAEILGANRIITPIRATLVIRVGFRHPDAQVAAQVANMFVEEYIAFDQRQQSEEIVGTLATLRQRADEQKRKVEEADNKIQEYKEKHNLPSLDSRRDTASARLQALNSLVTTAETSLKELQVRRDQIRQFQSEGRDLTELPFIAAQSQIGTLLSQRTNQRIGIGQLEKRYRAKHPRMIEAVEGLDRTEAELAATVGASIQKIEAEFEASRRSLEDLRAQLEAQKAETLRIDAIAVEYNTLQRNAQAEERLYQVILARAGETNAINVDATKIRAIDRAAPPTTHATPNIPLNLGLGFLGGIGLGIGFAFFVAFLDDRVKSAFDIEAVVGLPLVGIVPQLKKGEMHDRAQVVLNNIDKQVSEAFRTLHSSIKLNDESKSAQLILITSTIPSEGKSFVASNLALTFAAHGERTLLIDCDLRKPAVHKAFKIDNTRGVIDHCLGSISLDDAISRNVADNLDVMTAGGRSKSPTQLLNSKQFEDMLTELRKRYKRVIFDTPPLGAVSDATVILPSMDGSLFVIQFSRTKRKAATHVARRLVDSNVPCFGAVLNGLDIAVSGYYYSQYYDKAYKDYYIVSDREPDATADPTAEEPERKA